MRVSLKITWPILFALLTIACIGQVRRGDDHKDQITAPRLQAIQDDKNPAKEQAHNIVTQLQFTLVQNGF